MSGLSPDDAVVISIGAKVVRGAVVKSRTGNVVGENVGKTLSGNPIVVGAKVGNCAAWVVSKPPKSIPVVASGNGSSENAQGQ